MLTHFRAESSRTCTASSMRHVYGLRQDRNGIGNAVVMLYWRTGDLFVGGDFVRWRFCCRWRFRYKRLVCSWHLRSRSRWLLIIPWIPWLNNRIADGTRATFSTWNKDMDMDRNTGRHEHGYEHEDRKTWTWRQEDMDMDMDMKTSTSTSRLPSWTSTSSLPS